MDFLKKSDFLSSGKCSDFGLAVAEGLADISIITISKKHGLFISSGKKKVEVGMYPIYTDAINALQNIVNEVNG